MLSALVDIFARLFIGPSGERGRHRRIRLSLELLEKMPEDMQSREALRRHIDTEVGRLIQDEATKTRDLAGIVLAVAFAGGAYLVATQLADGNGLWWIAVVLLALFAAVGLSQDAIPRERDERGRAIREQKRDTAVAK